MAKRRVQSCRTAEAAPALLNNLVGEQVAVFVIELTGVFDWKAEHGIGLSDLSRYSRELLRHPSELLRRADNLDGQATMSHGRR